jgi:hypothetical protein
VTRPRPTLDEVALWVGVAVAGAIVAASYAVSATSVYGLMREVGYSRWQAFAGPLVADGPAAYGMVRVVARARRNTDGAWYGWALVGAGTACSIAGNVTHALTARPGSWVAGCVAALIPLAVVAMLEAARSDARLVYRVVRRDVRQGAPQAKQSPSEVTQAPASLTQPDAARVTQPAGHRTDAATHATADPGRRVAAALAGPPPPGGWTGPKLAAAAQVSRSKADRALRKHRTTANAGGEVGEPARQPALLHAVNDQQPLLNRQ